MITTTNGEPIALPALDGRSALGFLAALGATRLLADNGNSVTLSWSSVDATAVVRAPGLDSLDEVANALTAIVRAMPSDVTLPGAPPGLPPVGEAPDKLRLPPRDLRKFFDSFEVGADGIEFDRWLSALVTDLAVDTQGRGAHTLFGAYSGKQSMYTAFSKSLQLVRNQPELLRQALAGWRRVDGVTGEYLDHRVLFDAAASPVGESRERGVPGATWLALMALPVTRTTSADGTRPISTGWYASGRRMRVRWPLWSGWLSVPDVVALWDDPLLTAAARALDLANDQSDEPALVGTRIQGRLAHEQLQALGVFHIGRAERRKIPGRNFAGVLAPVE